MMLKALNLLHPAEDDVIEVRTVGKPVLSGYFTDKQKCVEQIAAYPNETWYVVMNSVNDACYGRTQHDCIIPSPKSTTSDKEVTAIQWLLIDVDPERPTGVGATDAEKKSAMAVIKGAHDYLKAEGFPEPVVCDSGNGYHLLYKVQLAPSDAEKVKAFLAVLDMYFSTPEAKIDTAVFNPARITKLYGTIAAKGANTQKRPHRESRIMRVPEPLQAVSVNQLDKVSSQLPKPEPRTAAQQFSGAKFDARQFLADNGVTVHHEMPVPGGMKLVLDRCPFDGNHVAPDSAVFLFDDGRIGFKCFHNSCDSKTWKDVRLLYDASYAPCSFVKRDYEAKYERRVEAPKADGTAFQDISEVKIAVPTTASRLRSNFTSLDQKLLGFNRGELTIWSGGNGSGKSTFLSQLALETVQNKDKVAIYSGELTGNRAKSWLYLQAAGTGNVREMPVNDGVMYVVNKDVIPQIDAWMKGNLFLYNNQSGNKANRVIEEFKLLMERSPVDVLIVDNLMSLDIGSEYDKWAAQTKVVLELSQLAKDSNCHVHFVCHPRKPNGFLRKTDIAGTADITNAADNVIMVHRVGDDFKKQAKEFYGAEAVTKYSAFSNVLEIMKNRDLGVQDELIGLYFEKCTKQFLNAPHVNRAYAWQEALVPHEESDCPF